MHLTQRLFALLPFVAWTAAIQTIPPPGSVPPVTVPFNRTLRSGSDDLAEDDQRIRPPSNPDAPQQVHLQYWGPGRVLISWVIGEAKYGPGPLTPPTQHTQSLLTEYWLLQEQQETNQESGWSEQYTYQYDFQGAWNYKSGTIHHVELRGLKSWHKYQYRVQGEDGSWSETFNFTMPPSAGEASQDLVLGLMADVGQTYNSTDTMGHMLEDMPHIVLHVGDISYADDWQSNGILDPWLTNVTTPTPPGDQRPVWGTYQHRWDLWGRLAQPLVSTIPHLYNTGNHEVERQSDLREFVSYSARFPAPPSQKRKNSHAATQLYYSVDVGLVHVVVITSYTDFEKGSPQYEWLRSDLASVDREVTPWLVVTLHAPLYNSYEAHFKENECMRLEIEDLLYEHHVDIVFNGHVHAYQRSQPVYKDKIDPCGPVHITIGDGGNIERLAIPFVDEPGHCPDPRAPAPWEQPQKCPTYHKGRYCPAEQPETSAFREPSFGHGLLRVHNASMATWTWNRNQEPVRVIADSVVLVQNRRECTKQGVSAS